MLMNIVWRLLEMIILDKNREIDNQSLRQIVFSLKIFNIRRLILKNINSSSDRTHFENYIYSIIQFFAEKKNKKQILRLPYKNVAINFHVTNNNRSIMDFSNSGFSRLPVYLVTYSVSFVFQP